MRGASPDGWWTHGDALRRVVTDLLAAELAQMRPGRPSAPASWSPDTQFVRDLGVDSLELMGLGTALAEALHLQRGGIDEQLLARPCIGDWITSARAGLDACATAGVAADELALTFRTSGSSGSPKRCTHALATLEQEIAALAQLVPGRRRVLSAVPSHHIYGFLFTVLLPRRFAGWHDGGAVEVIDMRRAGPAALAGLARPGDLIVAHPGWWEAAARVTPAFDADIVGVTSTAPCPDALAATLAAAGLRLLQVYGSSETAGVGWRDRADQPFTLLPYWTRADDAACLARTLPDGTARPYPLQDRLDWSDATHFVPAGRLDDAVQVGGMNVFPAWVADVLALHPQVREVAVRLMRPDEGRRLKAFVVPRSGADVDSLRADLPGWIAERLTAPERPVAWTFGPRLPRQASGKPADWIIDAE
ncbi:AMP-binding protein [Telluria mixta]|uniref:AMP-binding protein n=1 Tax=Telluria mixta TaxID=34071 RepID=A0ABT2C3J7_9BURK|nr:AMP-binding protein [Telluria mixta]MCS0631962.1 AMP-binding protein [Telluria mixta]WEM95359.1 AMP-binding protein [Telluria mixta]